MKFTVTCVRNSPDPEDKDQTTEVIDCKSRQHAKSTANRLKRDILVDSAEIEATREASD